jgi:lipoate-protein ligase B
MLALKHLGRMPYGEAWEAQRATQEAVIAGEAESTLLMVEHEPVYTLGRRRNAADNLLDVGDVPVVETERGGDVTFHGPGQLVVYPILRLEGSWKDLHRVMRAMEEAAIQTCADFGLQAGRDPRNTGAWVNGKKICAIGIGCRKWVTWHGMALNVCTDLSYFQRILPCGLESGLVTSMAHELGESPPWNRVQTQLLLRLQGVFQGLHPEKSP